MRYRPKKGQKGPKLHFEASRGFIYCLRSYFEFKTREEYYKLQSDTIFIDVYSICGGLCIKKGTKMVKKAKFVFRGLWRPCLLLQKNVLQPKLMEDNKRVNLTPISLISYENKVIYRLKTGS